MIYKEFEKTSGMMHLAYNKITNLWNHLRFNTYVREYGDDMKTMMQNANMNISYWTSEFQLLYKSAWNKLDQMMKELEGFEFIKLIRVLDPKQSIFMSKNIEEYKALFPNENNAILIKELRYI